MRKAFFSILLAGGGLLALTSPAGAASMNACNQGTMRAHQTVPHNPNSAAHASIPSCHH